MIDVVGKVITAAKADGVYQSWMQKAFETQTVTDRKLNMRLIMEKFLKHFTELYGNEGERFIEKEGRKYFLLYLRPIINGISHYSMEAVTGSDTRTDLILYYHEELAWRKIPSER